MGLLTWRHAKKGRREVQALRRDLAAQQTPPARPCDPATPTEHMRAASFTAAHEGRIRAELTAAGFRFSRLGVPKDAASRAALDAAYYYVIKDGMTISEAVENVASDRARVQVA